MSDCSIAVSGMTGGIKGNEVINVPRSIEIIYVLINLFHNFRFKTSDEPI